MSQSVTTSRLANTIARAIRRAFDQFQDEFREITRRAKQRFSERDWQGMHADSAARLDIYNQAIDHIVDRTHALLEDRVCSRLVWVSIKAVYSGLIDDRDDWEIAETFYNSITRRIFTTVGVDEEIEFVHTDFASPPTLPKEPIHSTYAGGPALDELILRMLGEYDFPLGGDQLRRESGLAAAEIERQLRALEKWGDVECIDMIKPAFYRGEHVHLVGRMTIAGQFVPLVLSFLHNGEGVFLASVLVEQDDVSLLFSYARSYFHVEAERPYELVRFIKTIIPKKPTAEIYISIGYNKHGKTELYRHALRHLAGSTDKYQLARGQRGMVMVVFTMPSYPVVFKIIKDQFDYPKETTRQAVIDCYRLVFTHDRAGRLIDAQQYEYMTLDRQRFDDELLDELLDVAGQTVSIQGDRVVIKHCYAERRVTPLNVYLQEAEEQSARHAVIDYGQTIKDLALTNIFPGDLMLKNFGVTRQRRLIFYDYDEVCLLTDCTFRKLPESDDYDEQMAAEPWYAVGKNDVFPEEFKYFLGLTPPLRAVFMEHHADLLTIDYWLDVQQQLRAGKLFHVPPYAAEKESPAAGTARRHKKASGIVCMTPIKYAVDETGIATITFNRDEKRNAVNKEMAGQILRCLEQAERDASRVVILRANPGVEVWCAGHDLAELDPQALHENPTLDVVDRIQATPVPVIAMVEGSVHGGGLILLLSADIVIAAENAEVAITSNKLGIPLSLDLHAYWLRVMGIHKAKELLFTAASISARDAYHAGLYNHVVKQARLERVTSDVARRIIECSAEAVAHTKHQLNLIARQTALGEEQRAGIARGMAEILDSHDTRQRISALLTSLRRS